MGMNETSGRMGEYGVVSKTFPTSNSKTQGQGSRHTYNSEYATPKHHVSPHCCCCCNYKCCCALLTHGQQAVLCALALRHSGVDGPLPCHRVGCHGLHAACNAHFIVAGLDGGGHLGNGLEACRERREVGGAVKGLTQARMRGSKCPHTSTAPSVPGRPFEQQCCAGLPERPIRPAIPLCPTTTASFSCPSCST